MYQDAKSPYRAISRLTIRPVKSSRDRGEFGVWLREQRTPLYKNVPLAVKALRQAQGYGIAPSVWAELEAGTRRPSPEQAEQLQSFFDAVAPREASSDIAAAINSQTVVLTRIADRLDAQTTLPPDSLRAIVALAVEGTMRVLVERGLLAPLPQPDETRPRLGTPEG